MADSIIPDKDADILANVQAFANGIAANPAMYMCSQVDALAITKAVNEFEIAFKIATTPKTRTPGAICEKDQTRNSAVAIIRTYANLIRANHGISDQAKIAIGIRPRKRDLTKRNCPQSSPLLMFIGSGPDQYQIMFSDSSTPKSRSKPFGAVRLELFMGLTDPNDPPPTHPSLELDPPDLAHALARSQYIGSFTRNPIVIEPPQPRMPRVVTYWGRWAGSTGETGPWSLALTIGIVGRIGGERKQSMQFAA